MRPGIFLGVGSALAWFVFPMVPAILGSAYFYSGRSLMSLCLAFQVWV
jgi:hypothetical protein